MRADNKRAYWVVGIVAATVSAATAAYLIWAQGKQRGASAAAESVEEILNRCHDQVKRIEQRLGDLPQAI